MTEAKRYLSGEQMVFFKENGYLHIKGLFTPEEVANFREGCIRDALGDSVCRREFHKIMLQPKVVNIIRDLLGDPVVYPGLSLTRTNDFPRPRGKYGVRFFHNDTMGDDGDYTHEYPILNTGIYLQDHVSGSNCLKIIPRSHTRPCYTSKTLVEAIKNIIKALLAGDGKRVWGTLNLYRSINIPSLPGDLIVWYVRTHHTGYGMRPRIAPYWSLPPVIENILPLWFFLPSPPRREVMLSIYTKPSPYLEKYIELQINKERRREYYLHNACLENPEVLELARSQNVVIRNDGYHRAQDPTPMKSTKSDYA